MIKRRQNPGKVAATEPAFEHIEDTGTPITVDREYYPEPARFRRELKKAGPIYQELSEAAAKVIGGVRVGRSLEPEPLLKPVAAMIASVIRHPDALVWMRKLDNQPSYLTGHSVRLSVLSTVLARDMGLAKVQLHRVAMAALLSQIGKTKLPRSLLETPEPLSDEDLSRIRKFIDLGVDLLRDCQMIGEDIIEIVHKHHERFDGSGYPGGISNDAIPVLARLVGVADWYDAATTVKPHTSEVLSANQAMDEMYRQRGKQFQPQIVEEFIRAMGIYPCGNLVQLAGNEVALVVAQNLQNRTQPMILMVLDRSGRPFEVMDQIDLYVHNQTTHDKPLTIKRALSVGELDLDPNEIMGRASRQKRGWLGLLGR